MSAIVPALPALDERQRYTIPETCWYLRFSRAKLYMLIRSGEIRVIKDGERTFIPGTEIIKRSTLPAA
jgi:excisionase family DNA binding protein